MKLKGLSCIHILMDTFPASLPFGEVACDELKLSKEMISIEEIVKCPECGSQSNYKKKIRYTRNR